MFNATRFFAAKRHLTIMRELIGLEVLLNGKSIKTPYLIVAINAARNSPRIRLLRNI